jgi:hypothetical protein
VLRPLPYKATTMATITATTTASQSHHLFTACLYSTTPRRPRPLSGSSASLSLFDHPTAPTPTQRLQCTYRPASLPSNIHTLAGSSGIHAISISVEMERRFYRTLGSQLSTRIYHILMGTFHFSPKKTLQTLQTSPNLLYFHHVFKF